MAIRIFNRRYSLNRFYLPLYLFFFIFAPPIIPNINSFHILFLYTFIILIFKYYGLFRSFIRKKICRIFFYGYILLLLYVVALMMICMISGKINIMNEITQLYRYFMVVLELPVCSIYISIYCRKNGYRYYDLIKNIIYAGLIQSIFTILMFSSPSIKSKIVNFMSITNGNGGSFLNMSAWEYARRYNAFSDNLQDAFGWGTGIIAGLALFLALHYNKKYFWAFPFLIFVPLLNSVTGLVFSGIMIFIILLPYVMTGNFKGIKYIVGLLVGGILIAIIVICVNPFIFKWVSSNILAIGKLGRGSASSTSFGHLMNNSNWIFPENVYEIVFGTGHNVMGDALGYHHADPGLTNNIWLMGIVGTTYLYCLWSVVIGVAEKKMGHEFFSLFFSVWVCFILFEIKGLTNFYNPGMAITECLIFSTLIENKYKKIYVK